MKTIEKIDGIKVGDLIKDELVVWRCEEKLHTISKKPLYFKEYIIRDSKAHLIGGNPLTKRIYDAYVKEAQQKNAN